MRCFSQEEICPLERSAIRGAIACPWFSSKACLWGTRSQTKTATSTSSFLSPFAVVLRHWWTLLCDKHATVWKDISLEPLYRHDCSAEVTPGRRRTWTGRGGLLPQLCRMKEPFHLSKPVSPSAPKARALNDASNCSLKSTSTSVGLTALWAKQVLCQGYKHIYINV